MLIKFLSTILWIHVIFISIPVCQMLWSIVACPEELLPLARDLLFVAEQLQIEYVGMTM